MKHIKLFENFTNDKNRVNNSVSVIAYHGGDYINNETLNDSPIFFTTDLEGAEYYASECGDSGCIMKANIKIENPLSDSDFDEIWIKILDDAKIEYEYNTEPWNFDCDAINGYSNCIFDLVYTPEFVISAIKFGYDGIIGNDVLGNSEIPVYIPFRKQSVDIIGTVDRLDESVDNTLSDTINN